MRVNVLAALALMMIGSFLSGSYAQAQQAAAATVQGTRIGTIDVGKIVKNHPAIKNQQAVIREQFKTAQEDLMKRRQALVTEVEKLKQLNEGSAEFNKLQEMIANQEAQLKLDSVRREKELEELEAKMALEFYKQLQAKIILVADYYQIDIVLRSNTEDPDLKQPATIQMALEKGVVFSRGSLDMTDAVLKLLSQDTGAAPTATVNPAAVNAAQPNGRLVK